MPRLFALCVFLVLAGRLSAETDWEKIAREAEWKWPLEEPSLLSTVADDLWDGPYEAVITCYPPNVALKRFKDHDDFGCFFELKVVRDGKVLFQKPAHERTVFRIWGNRIFFAQFKSGSDGCKLICFDLDAQKLLWETQLKAAGFVTHSIYRNRVSLPGAYKGAIVVYGWEDAGKYVEYLDRDTGKTLAHRLFE